MRFALPGVFLALASLTSGCATASGKDPPPRAAAVQFNDPLENVNRAIFHFNDSVVDRFILTPIATVYNTVLPEPARNALHNFYRNLRGPIIFANDVLQGRPTEASNTLGRFIMNSTFGVGGLIDVAADAGIPYHYQDFGVTFGAWGVPPGPYLVLPVLGPSDPRDLVGNVAEGFADPWNRIAADNGEHIVIYARSLASGVSTYARNMKQLKALKRTSIDYYAAVRSLYQQRRASLITRGGKAPPPTPGLTENRGTRTVTVRKLPPPSARLAEGETPTSDPRPFSNEEAAGGRAELFPPEAATVRATVPRSKRGGGAELFPPPNLVARKTGGPALSSR